MNKKLIIMSLALSLLCMLPVFGDPRSFNADVTPLENIERYDLIPQVDVATLLAEDDANEGKGAPFRVASQEKALIEPNLCGTIDYISDGVAIWRLRVFSKNAVFLSFIFSGFFPEENMDLYVYNPSLNLVFGPYNSGNITEDGSLGTPIIPGEESIIELYFQSGIVKTEMVLDTVCYGYKEPFGSKAAGACEVDINCPTGNNWQNDKRAVARLYFGGYLCTGSLLNDVPQDCKNYFLTANHCISTSHNASICVFYWNYEKPSCNSGSGSLDQNQTGSTLRATNSNSDFTLLELNEIPNSAFNVYYAGWTNTSTAATSGTCIHHPQGDVKKISVDNSTLVNGSYYGTTHWRTPSWDVGATEGGSSGSGLWDQNHRVVGQLHGGASSCTASPENMWDEYGKFAVSWATGSTAATRLKDWLDPGNTGTVYVSGKNNSTCGGGCTAPGAPNLTAATGTCSGVDLTWTAGSGTTLSYNIYRDTGTCDGSYIKLTGPVTGTSHSDTTAVAGTAYAYVIRGCCDAAGTTESGYSNCRAATRLATPAAPAAPMVTDDCSGLLVSWTAVSGATSYTVQRGTKSNCTSQAAIGTSATTSYPDDTAALNTNYYYTVIAENACGNSAASACSSAAVHSVSTPGAPTITSITDDNACAQSGIHVNFTAGSGATSHNLIRNGTAVVTGYTSGALYNPGATTTYTYVVRAVNSCGTADSTGSAFSDANNTPGTPSITGITDNDSCAQNGIKVNFTAGSGAASHNLLRDGSVVMTGYTSGTTYDPGDTASHNYVIRAVNGSCANDSTTVAGTDYNGVPGAPTITGISDEDACAQSGIRVNFTAGSGATSHDLYRDGVSVVTGYTSGTLYNPGNTSSHTYYVRGINSCGGMNSGAQAFADANGAPGTPAISSVTDVSACALSGVTITWGNVAGATGYDLYIDAATTVTSITSPYVYSPGNTFPHSYQVRAKNASCTGIWSTAVAGTDVNNATTPTITGASANTCPSTEVQLTTESGMSSYQWYVGGSPIGGANSNSYLVTATGSYTVSYTNGSGCSGTSAAHAVTISPCAPNIVYSAHGTFTEITGNGDSYYDLGEKWSVQVNLTNNGTAGATNVTATPAGNGIEVCTHSMSFGDIAISGAGSATFEFVIDTGFTPCGGSIGFDVTTKACTELTPAGADELDVFSITVGQPSGGTTTLFGPDDFADINNWITDGYSSATGNACHDTNIAQSNGSGTYYLTLASAVSTVGMTNITVNMDWGLTSPAQTTQYLDWSTDNATWNNAASTSNNGMLCNQSQILPAGAEGQSTLYIRFQTVSGGATRYGQVDYVSITGEGGGGWDCSYVGSGTCSTCVMTVNITPDGTTTACAGEDIVFTATPGGGAAPYNYQWTENGLDIGGATNSAYTANKSSAGSFTYNCQVTDSGSCVNITDASDSTGTWNAIPATPAPTNNGPICAGSTLNLSANATADSYAWTGPNGFTSAQQNPGITNATTAATGTYSLVVTVSGCSSAAGTTDATVNAAPIAEVIETVNGKIGFDWVGTDAENYRVVRSLNGNLGALITGDPDFACTPAFGAINTVDIQLDDPQAETGRCYYYLIQGYNGTDPDLCVGPAGDATAGPRQVELTNTCD